ncbi:uncharacterized protein LOC136092322 isoform X3 [Hydra vulgaris]|uniref:Uncharacterized protein LOC136092322 isoform X3 n=1 Tax=Hydra vulgaris TaxID=6087 RepID=A0ABM4DP47_HYDVU
MSYALVFWVNSQQTSIVPSIAVSDKRMLTDDKRVGKVKWMDEKKKVPSEGWSSHDGRVLSISDKRIDLSKEENKYWTEKDNFDSDISKSPSSSNESHRVLFNEESASKKLKMYVCNSENKLKQKTEDYAAKSFNKRILSAISSNCYNENEMDSENLDKMPWFSQSQTVTAMLKSPNTARLPTSSSCSKCKLLASTVQKYRDDLPKMFGFMQQSLTSALSQSSSECLDNASSIASPQIASFAASTTTLSRSMDKPSANQQKNQQFIVNSPSPSNAVQNVTGVQQVDESLGCFVKI